jgi:hypothetical protein
MFADFCVVAELPPSFPSDAVLLSSTNPRLGLTIADSVVDSQGLGAADDGCGR